MRYISFLFTQYRLELLFAKFQNFLLRSLSEWVIIYGWASEVDVLASRLTHWLVGKRIHPVQSVGQHLIIGRWVMTDPNNEWTADENEGQLYAGSTM